jgi:hypothetical protein
VQLILPNPPRKSRRRSAGRKRRKLSPAQRRVALANLAKARRARGITSKPARRRRRSRPTTAAGSPVPPALPPRTRRRSRRSGVSAMARRSRRRNSRRSAGNRASGGFLPPGGIAAIAGTAGGFIAASIVPRFVPVAALQQGPGRIAAKAAAGVLTYMLLRKTNKTVGAALAGGMLASAGVDLAELVRQRVAPNAPALSGIGAPDGLDYSATDLAGEYEEAPLI